MEDNGFRWWVFHGLLPMLALCGVIWLVGYLESLRDKLGFSIVGVIIIVAIGVCINKMTRKD